jgi:hypothetical protein
MRYTIEIYEFMNLKFEKNFKRSQCLTTPIPSVMIVEMHFNNQLSLDYDCIILDKSTLADQFPSRASLVGHVHRLIGHVEKGISAIRSWQKTQFFCHPMKECHVS